MLYDVISNNDESNFVKVALKIFRSSRSGMFFKTSVFKNSIIFTGKHLCWGLFLIKKTCNLIKKRLQDRYFPVNIATYLRTAILLNTSCGCFSIFHTRILSWTLIRFFVIQNQPSMGVLIKRSSKTWSKFTGEHQCRTPNSAWVFSCKSVAYFQNSFS